MDELPVQPPVKTKKRRKQFTPSQRRAILAKTGNHCYSCGDTLAEGEDWWIEHIVPFAGGGTDEPENLLPSCKTCNHLRLHHSPVKFRQIMVLGDAMIREIERGSEIGKTVQSFMEVRDKRRAKLRKYPHATLRPMYGVPPAIILEQLTGHNVPVHVTQLAPLSPSGPKMADSLESITSSGGPSGFGDPVEWQRESRTDRDLPGRE